MSSFCQGTKTLVNALGLGKTKRRRKVRVDILRNYNLNSPKELQTK